MGKVNRVTLFKLTDTSVIPQMLKSASTMKQDALKDGKPYILRIEAGPAVDDARNQGYNYMIQTTFASLEDMKYYDEEDEAHARLKASVGGKFEGKPLTVFSEEFVGSS